MENNKLSPQATLLRQIFWFFSCWLGGAILALLLMPIIAAALGVGDFSHLLSKIKEGEFLEHINTVKIVSMIGHFCSYTVSTLAFAYLIHRQSFFKYLLLNKLPRIINIPLIIICLIAVYPLAIWIAYININLLPEHWVAEDTLVFEQRLMQMNSVGDLLLNLLLLGFVAGIGEELLFRGVIQRFIAQYSKSLHVAVWGTAILFSLIHFQPEGFVPRFLLGALLGYIFVWTGSLWASIIGHVTFNSAQVLLFYYVVDIKKMESVYQKPDFSIVFTLLSVLIFIFACFMLWKLNQAKSLKESDYIEIS